MRTIRQWLARKWQPQPPALAQDYRAFAATDFGQRILQHWMDNVYCTLYAGTDPAALWMHEGRRSVIHEILEAIDYAETPAKYPAP